MVYLIGSKQKVKFTGFCVHWKAAYKQGPHLKSKDRTTLISPIDVYDNECCGTRYYCMKYVRICKYLNSLFLIANGYMNESIAEFCLEFEYKVSIDIAKNRIFYVIKSTRNAVMQ